VATGRDIRQPEQLSPRSTLTAAGAWQPTFDVPTDSTFQSAPMRWSTTVERSTWTPGLGTTSAAAQIGDDAAMRHLWTVN
jgi:hypothetical protein